MGTSSKLREDARYDSSDNESTRSSKRKGNKHLETAEDTKVKGPKESAFRYMYPIMDLSIPPSLFHDPRRAAGELLDTLLMRYVPQLGGVLISHMNITFLRPLATVDADGAFSIVPVGLTALVWAPKIGMRLEGQIKLSTPSHVSLLVHGIFNASITAAHLPSSLESAQLSKKDHVYDWHEFGDVDAMQEVHQEQDSDEDLGEKSTGRWVDRKTGKNLGDEEEKVVFTVVGITVANHMTFIHGSLLKRPFSIPAPTHIPDSKLQGTEASADRRVRFQDGHQTTEFHPYESDSDEDSDEDKLSAPVKVRSSQSKKKKKKASREGPRLPGDTSGSSDTESEGRREKKKHKKSHKA